MFDAVGDIQCEFIWTFHNYLHLFVEKQESGGGDCKDLDPSKIGCANYTDYCKHQYMVANCKKTCGNCQEGGGNCKNKNAKCLTWASYGYCKEYKNYMQKECPKACKVCWKKLKKHQTHLRHPHFKITFGFGQFSLWKY